MVLGGVDFVLDLDYICAVLKCEMIDHQADLQGQVEQIEPRNAIRVSCLLILNDGLHVLGECGFQMCQLSCVQLLDHTLRLPRQALELLRYDAGSSHLGLALIKEVKRTKIEDVSGRFICEQQMLPGNHMTTVH